MSHQPIHITASAQKEAILDCVYRAVNAYDRNDLALHDSAWLTSSPTTTFVLNGSTLTGMDQIRKPFELVGPMNTTHMGKSQYPVDNLRPEEYDMHTDGLRTSHEPTHLSY